MHGENDYRSTDITERNLLELFHELATQTPYKHDPSSSRKYGAIRLKMGQCLTYNEFNTESHKNNDNPWIFIDGIRIHILSADYILSLQQNVLNKWSKFFDITFVGHNYFTFLQDSFVNVLNHQALLILETKLWSTARKDEINNFEDKLLNYAKRNNLQSIINYDALNSKYSILKFKNVFG